jgi:hypothetical protein
MIKQRKMTLSDVFHLSSRINQQDEEDELFETSFNSIKINDSYSEDLELPKNSHLGYYYWIGKDYANTYLEDFKDVQDALKGN